MRHSRLHGNDGRLPPFIEKIRNFSIKPGKDDFFENCHFQNPVQMTGSQFHSFVYPELLRSYENTEFSCTGSLQTPIRSQPFCACPCTKANNVRFCKSLLALQFVVRTSHSSPSSTRTPIDAHQTMKFPVDASFSRFDGV